MTHTELQRYRAALTAKVAELSQTLRDRRPIAIETAAEDCERIVLAAERELSVVTLDRHSRLLREARAALARIDEGSYGVCENCEEPIKPKRLEAVPWARYCVQCQDRIDREPNAESHAVPRIPLAA